MWRKYKVLIGLVFLLNCLCARIVASISPAAATAQFLAQQIDDPCNPVFSYNLGIAAMQDKKYSDAERHFSLATELYERTGTTIIPAYFSWADTAALQLIDALQSQRNAQKELKGAALDAAINHARNASDRYANVLVFDAHHEQARERKKIVDRLKQLLEAKKQEQKEEEKKKEEEKNNQQSHDQDSENKDQNDQKQNDQKQNDDSSESSSGSDKSSDRREDKDQNNTQSPKDRSQEKEKEESKKNNESNKGEEPKESKDTEKKDSVDQPDEASGGEENHAGEENKHEEQEQEGEEKRAAVAAPAQYDVNAEMAKKRAKVLLDKLQQNEADLQKAQLLKKSAQQTAAHGRYNQW